MEESNHNRKMYMRHGDFIPLFGRWLLHIVVTSFGQGLHSIPLKWSKDQTGVQQLSSFSQVFPLWGISTSWSLSPLQDWSQIGHKSKRGNRTTHTRQTCSDSRTHTMREKSTKTTQRSYSSKQVPKSQSTKAKAWIRCLSIVGCSKSAWCCAPCA
jgi:hypothetical protein